MRWKVLKGIFIFLTSALWILSPVTHAQEKPLQAVIIHQIRGDESCCRSGTAEMVSSISTHDQLQDLPLAWALRYDVLKNDELVQSYKDLPQSHSLGILLEVTPRLASESGVLYKGRADGADWSEARHAFLVGYTQIERQKLIDTVFAEYYRKFESFPEFTVSWMIDSWSLQYLHEKYGVRVHELTKEQYETDGYTLYGGPFNTAFFSSRNHPLMQGIAGQELDVLMLRQTVSDIDKNYGSAKSYFTSQPNDYLSNPAFTDISYFKSLIGSLTRQKTQDGIAVLGLENSQEWQEFQTEYLNQLTYIFEERAAGRIDVLRPIDLYDREKSKKSSAKLLHTEGFPQTGSLWYFGRKYRARIESWQGKLVLTDFRVYPSTMLDPYKSHPLDKSQAYWVMPYLLDSSQQLESIDEKPSQFTGDSVRTDHGVTRFGIELGEEIPIDFTVQGDAIVLKTPSGQLTLNPEGIEVLGSQPRLMAPLNLDSETVFSQNTDQYFTFSGHPRFVLSPKPGEIIMGWENKRVEVVPMATLVKSENRWILKPNVDVTQTQIESLAHIFQPDRTSFAFAVDQSTFFWHNTQAIAGKSAVRLFIDPRNILGRPVAPKSVQYILSDPEGIEVSVPQDLQNHMEQFFVDFSASENTQTDVQLMVDGNIIGETTTITFWTDCTKQWTQCLKNTDQGKQFLQVFIDEKRQEYEQKLVLYIKKVKSQLFNYILKYLPTIVGR